MEISTEIWENKLKTKKRKVPFFKPSIPPESFKEVEDTLKSGWLTRGNRTVLFEKAFSDYLDSKYTIGVNSGTSALHASLVSLGIGPKDEVITTSMTWPSTVNVIENVGAIPVFADINKNNLNINLEDIKRKVTRKTKAIIPVDIYGNPTGIQAIIDFAKENEIFVVEDAAHAIEAIEDGIKIGTRATTTCFSLYANKNLTTGEGGIIATEDKELFLQLKILCNSGISLDAWSKDTMNLSARRVTVVPGFKYNMFDVQAALGIHQIPYIENEWKKREEKYLLYKDLLSKIPNVQLINHDVPQNSKHSHHLLVISLELEKINTTQLKLINDLKERGISTGIHYYPVHLHPYYKKYNSHLPVTDFYSQRLVSLPFFPSMKEEEIEYVTFQLKNCLR